MEAFRDWFTAAELLSYKEVLYEKAMEEWYAPYDPKEVKREERSLILLARQLYHLVEMYRDVLFQSRTHSAAIYLERYILHVYYTSQLDNDDDKKVGQLELDWITWQRDYMQNRAWCKSRTCTLEAM